ncbi:nitroreductase family deazaflavin-dependent oxidoreductase [Streptomyces sp. WMMC500]|uniref:nitroreductase family deazaflavin-dependent oxidoreductase n=1 Tax=Streptomyces sp. WMMC500 TaxID=3015154 RepID=UPI00248D0917|nr:nitroreductase family deazaflavin-dependent oxidoreductase [Streptomyces sp. WMMC500]WBB64266.1 nitroreductase family deazaflavin-dependent oxidoreductase [Streptomyces sp. WMMC500]
MTMPRAFRRIGRTVNPAVLPLARRMPPLAVVEHVGRRSAKRYQTPVQAFRTETGWVIALAYGADVHWIQNMLAAGGGHLVRRGRRYTLTRPARVHGDPGRRLLPPWARALMALVRVRDYATFTAAEPEPPVKRS